jgi:hypothetical protein
MWPKLAESEEDEMLSGAIKDYTYDDEQNPFPRRISLTARAPFSPQSSPSSRSPSPSRTPSRSASPSRSLSPTNRSASPRNFSSRLYKQEPSDSTPRGRELIPRRGVERVGSYESGSGSESEENDELVEYIFTGEPQQDQKILERFKGIIRKQINGDLYTRGDKSKVVFNLTDNIDFWWHPPWYVLNALGSDNLKKHLTVMDNADYEANAILGFQKNILGHNNFALATHGFPQGSYYKTYLETDVQGDIETFVGRLLKDGLTFTDYLDY